MKNLIGILFTIAVLTGCDSDNRQADGERITIDTLQGTSLLGTPLISKQLDPQKDSSRIAKYEAAFARYKANPEDADALVWYGRRTAYLGDYQKAIKIYTEGIAKFPKDARMYRHRGHRYISTRQFNKAITDFKKAVELIAGKEDVIEPDGIPNSRNTPISTLHNNIWYHLGLAYYLQNDMGNALSAYEECLKTSTNPDMLVASSHWLYMILRRMNKNDEAAKILLPINKDLDVFENMAYHNLLLFYKQEITEANLLGKGGVNEAVDYGLGNWYYYNSDTKKARGIFTKLVQKGNWAAFGYIAAEADLSRMK